MPKHRRRRHRPHHRLRKTLLQQLHDQLNQYKEMPDRPPPHTVPFMPFVYIIYVVLLSGRTRVLTVNETTTVAQVGDMIREQSDLSNAMFPQEFDLVLSH